MKTLTHLSLFSGIGGLDLAAEWAGFTTIAFVERDKYCQRVLAKHWPDTRIFEDVRDVTRESLADADIHEPGALTRNAEEVRGLPHEERGTEYGSTLPRGNGAPISILSGGFPCQPHSIAGKRQASLDERDLWGECVRITDEFRPRWCVFENVPGLLTSERGTFFARVLGDLAALGYRVGWGVWGANDVGAVHKRDRVFIVARDSHAEGIDGRWMQSGNEQTRDSCGEPAGELREDVADAKGERPREARGFHAGSSERPSGGRETCEWDADSTGECWRSEPEVGRVAHGVPRRVDRLRALGNAVVPQQAYPLFKAIADIERGQPND